MCGPSIYLTFCLFSDCVFRGGTKWKLLDHIRTHTQEKVLACPTCGTLFANKTKFRDHLQRQNTTEDTSHVCSVCKKMFASERLLKQHLHKHVNKKRCPHCDMTCVNDSALMYHMAYKHSEDKPHECPLCQKKYKTQYALADHMDTHQDKGLLCNIPGCYFVAKTTRGLSQHMRIEHQDEVFSCHICEESFKQGADLTRHLKESHGFSLPPGHSRFRYATSIM